MQFKVLGAFVVGVVLCAGVTGGGLAAAKSQKQAATKQVDVKLEWVTVSSSGGKTIDSLVLVADAGQQATSKNINEHDGVQTQQNATVTAKLNSDGTATLNLSCHVTKSGKELASAGCMTTLTVHVDETKVVRSFARKTGTENSETLLFVTTTVQ